MSLVLNARQVWSRSSPRRRLLIVLLPLALLGLLFPLLVQFFSESTPPARPLRDPRLAPTTPPTLNPAAEPTSKPE